MTSATVQVMTAEAAPKVHPFERAGLGVAPFRYLGCERVVYQAVAGDPNCPIQPGGSCDYCGTGIYLQCAILSADGRRFKVGSDCVAKVGGSTLKQAVESDERKRAREARALRATAVRANVTVQLTDPAVREALASKPHPRCFDGKSLLDWAEWMLANAGAKGRAEVARKIAGVTA